MTGKGESSRARGPNFSRGEQVLLTRALEDYSHIIESKKTDNIKQVQKQDAWVKVTQIFNENTKNVPRTTDNLISCYRNMKSKIKKQHSEAKMILKDKGEPLNRRQRNVSDSLLKLTEEKLELVRLQKMSEQMKIKMQQFELDNLIKEHTNKNKLQQLEIEDLIKQNEHKEEIRRRELILLDLQIKKLQ